MQTQTNIVTVADAEAARSRAVATKADAEARIAEGDEGAVSALDAAIRAIEAADRALAHAHTLAKAHAEAAKARERNEARAELAEVEAAIAARLPRETANAETVARARVALEAAEGEALAFLNEGALLRRRRAALAARAEGKPVVGHAGNTPFELELGVALARKRLFPSVGPSDFARFYGPPLWPDKRPAPSVQPTAPVNEPSTTRRNRGTR